MAAATLVLVRTARFGPGVTSDTVNYLVAARRLAHGGDLLTYNDQPFVNWPPLLPGLLALRSPATLEDGLRLLRLLNAGCFAGLVLVAGSWLRSVNVRPQLVVGGALAVALGPPLLDVASFGWSEPLFVLLCAACLWRLDVARRHSDGSILLPAALAAAAMLTRYIGVVLVPVGVLCLLAATRQRHRVRRAALFAAVAGVPLAVWLARNVAVAGTATGVRPFSTLTVASALSTAAGTLGGWLAPRSLPGPARALVAVALVAAVGVAFAGRRKARHRSGRPAPAAAAPSAAAPAGASGPVLPALPAVAFVALYCLAVVASEVVSRIDLPNDRILVPVFVPVLVAGCWALDRAAAPGRVAAAAGVWLAGLAAGAAAGTVAAVRDGVGGYTTRDWRRSDLVAAIRADPPPDPAVTNVPAAVYFNTDRLLIRAPSRPDLGGAERLDLLRRLLDEHGSVTVVWFDESPPDVRLHDLEENFRLEVVVSANDGRVYRATR